MIKEKPNLFALQKEVTVALKQKISEITFECDISSNNEEACVYMKADSGGHYFMGTFKSYELENVAAFFRQASSELHESNRLAGRVDA